MRFLVDAQLPRRLARWLTDAGHEAVHTLDLQSGNRKDDDFVHSLLVVGHPARLLLVTTGNLGNRELEQIFRNRLTDIIAALSQHRFVEIGRDTLVVHN